LTAKTGQLSQGLGGRGKDRKMELTKFQAAKKSWVIPRAIAHKTPSAHPQEWRWADGVCGWGKGLAVVLVELVELVTDQQALQMDCYRQIATDGTKRRG